MTIDPAQSENPYDFRETDEPPNEGSNEVPSHWQLLTMLVVMCSGVFVVFSATFPNITRLALGRIFTGPLLPICIVVLMVALVFAALWQKK